MNEPTTREPSEQSFFYQAFISYRHVEPDRRWAKWLHGALETYRVPDHLVKTKDLPKRIGRVFRDEEELPASADLSNAITEALDQSRFLIVICSPRAPKSEWVNAEVQRFRDLGRHDRILALLIEGEPAEAFPRAACSGLRRGHRAEHSNRRTHQRSPRPAGSSGARRGSCSGAVLRRLGYRV